MKTLEELENEEFMIEMNDHLSAYDYRRLVEIRTEKERIKSDGRKTADCQ